jgi:hypothetical protein
MLPLEEDDGGISPWLIAAIAVVVSALFGSRSTAATHNMD